MITPWGELRGLDLENHELAVKILSADKHQLVEGLVVEFLFDQIVTNFEVAGTRRVIPLDVDSVVVDTRRKEERWLAFVLVRRMDEGLGRYLIALEKGFTPYLVIFKDGEFFAAQTREGRRVSDWILLSEMMLELSGGRYEPFHVDASVKNANRQRQAFWGYISDFYNGHLSDRVVLPRILLNCGIQPYFRAVWNLDRAFVIDNDIWLLEIKHKFPFIKNGLRFGINDGEIGIIDRLTSIGIRCLFTILVKPYWSKDIGSMYLFNNLNMRERAAIIAKVLDGPETARILEKTSGKSGVHTSITGLSDQRYKSIPADEFQMLGLLSDPPMQVAARMSSVISGISTAPVQDDWLRGLRASIT